MVLNRVERITILVAFSVGMVAITGCENPRADELTEAAATGSPSIVWGTATPASTATLVPAIPNASATVDPAEPFNLGLIPDQVSTDPGVLSYVSASQLIVAGRVEEILPARWSTPDGTRPKNPDDVVPQGATIVTPCIVALDGPPILNRTTLNLDSGRIIALINGGTTGNDSVTIHLPWMQFAIGERVLMTLDGNSTAYNPPGPITTSAGPGWWITMKWTLTDDGLAVSWRDTRAAAELEAEFNDAVEFLRPGIAPTTTPVP